MRADECVRLGAHDDAALGASAAPRSRARPCRQRMSVAPSTLNLMIDFGELLAAAVPVALASILQIATHPAMVPVWITMVVGGVALKIAGSASKAVTVRRRRRRRHGW